MRRSTAIAAVTGLFLVGILAGVFGTHLFYLRHLREPGWLVKMGTHLLAADLKRDLDLTAEQEQEIDAILANTRRDVIALRREMTPRVLAILDQSRSRISQVLTPEQRQRFERFRERRGARLQRFLTGE